MKIYKKFLDLAGQVMRGVCAAAKKMLSSAVENYGEPSETDTAIAYGYPVVIDGKEEVYLACYEDVAIENDGALMVSRGDYAEALGYSRSYKSKEWESRTRCILNKAGKTYRAYIVVVDAEGNELENTSKAAKKASRVSAAKKTPQKIKPEPAPVETKTESKPAPKKSAGKPGKMQKEVDREIESDFQRWVKASPEERKKIEAERSKRTDAIIARMDAAVAEADAAVARANVVVEEGKALNAAFDKYNAEQKEETVTVIETLHRFENTTDFKCFALAVRDHLAKGKTCNFSKQMVAPSECVLRSIMPDCFEELKKKGMTITCGQCPMSAGASESKNKNLRKKAYYKKWKERIDKLK